MLREILFSVPLSSYFSADFSNQTGSVCVFAVDRFNPRVCLLMCLTHLCVSSALRCKLKCSAVQCPLPPPPLYFSLAAGGRHCACNTSCVCRLRSGCRVSPWQSLCLRREPLPIALTDQAPSVAVPSTVCLSTSSARNALGYCRPAHTHTALTNRISEGGTLDLYFWDSCVHCPASSELREANGEGPRITEGAGFCCCKTCR